MEIWREELYHFGTPGMRWGIRRYQNEDGTYTELGKRRLSSGKKDNRVNVDDRGMVSEADRHKANSKIHSAVADDYRNLSNIANSSSNVARNASNLNRLAEERRKEKNRGAARKEVSEMSNAELQAAINRMNLERSYSNLKAESMSSGRSAVSDVLSVSGEVLAMAASVASIAVAVHTIKGS